MTDYTYLIVGGGMTADAAVRGIRSRDEDGAIDIVSAEAHPPYNRPPLSKGLWQGKSLDKIWREIAELDVDLHLERRVETLDVDNKQVIDDQGKQIGFDKLLLATGGTPRRLPFGDEKIIYFRTLEDYKKLRDLADSNERFAVIGGGFIGSEIAAALAMQDKEVVMLFPERGVGGLALPPDVSDFLTDYYREQGVEVIPGAMVSGLASDGERLTLHTEAHGDFEIEGVVAGIGIDPNIKLAEAAGLEVDNGIVVDPSLQTSRPDIYAAGDVANFYNPALDERIRVEHENNANTMGKLAGQAMAGDSVSYDHLPFFYTDLFDVSYQAVGRLNPEFEIVADWAEEYEKGVIYYLDEGMVRGVLMWDVWGQVDAAQALIVRQETFEPADEVKGEVPIA